MTPPIPPKNTSSKWLCLALNFFMYNYLHLVKKNLNYSCFGYISSIFVPTKTLTLICEFIQLYIILVFIKRKSLY